MKQLQMTWRWWAKSLGQKASNKDYEADKVAIIRTLIFATYLVTNAFIIGGVMRHWNDKTQILIEIHETTNPNENSYTKRRHNLGMARDTRVENVYR